MPNDVIPSVSFIDPSHIACCNDGICQRPASNGILYLSLDTNVTLGARRLCYACSAQVSVKHSYLPNEIDQRVLVILPLLGERFCLRVFFAAKLESDFKVV